MGRSKCLKAVLDDIFWYFLWQMIQGKYFSSYNKENQISTLLASFVLENISNSTNYTE